MNEIEQMIRKLREGTMGLPSGLELEAAELLERLAEQQKQDGLVAQGYGDDDERWGETVEQYVSGCSESHDYDDLISGERFNVDAYFYRTEQWRTVSVNPIKCERMDAAPVAKAQDGMVVVPEKMKLPCTCYTAPEYEGCTCGNYDDANSQGYAQGWNAAIDAAMLTKEGEKCAKL